jgi:hypothetical protein
MKDSRMGGLKVLAGSVRSVTAGEDGDFVKARQRGINGSGGPPQSFEFCYWSKAVTAWTMALLFAKPIIASMP